MGDILDSIRALGEERGECFANDKEVIAWLRKGLGFSVNKPAHAPSSCSGCGCEHDEIHNPTDTCATCNGGSGYHPPKPAPAPLPESDDVAEALAEISAAGLKGIAVGLRFHIKGLTRRLAVCENRMFDIGEGVSISHDFVEAHIADLTRRLAEAEADQCEICKKNEIERYRAEARIADLEAQLSGVGVRQYREAVERLHKSEAFRARVMEWARGEQCGVCKNNVHPHKKCFDCSGNGGETGSVNNWTPAWEVGE